MAATRKWRQVLLVPGLMILALAACTSAARAQEADNVPKGTPSPYAGKSVSDVLNPDPETIESEGAKSAPPSTLPGAGAVVKMLLWVLVLIVFIYVCVYLVRRYVPSARNMFGSGVLKVVGRTYIASKQCILLVKVGPKYVMVGVTGTSMTPLAEISDPEDARKISEHLIAQSAESIRHTFGGILKRAGDDYKAPEETSEAPEGETASVDALRRELDEVTRKMGAVRPRDEH